MQDRKVCEIQGYESIRRIIMIVLLFALITIRLMGYIRNEQAPLVCEVIHVYTQKSVLRQKKMTDGRHWKTKQPFLTSFHNP